MKYKFIFALHGTVFTAFTLLNMFINSYIVSFLEGAINYAWLKTIVELLISAFLYVGLYMIVYNLYKYININIKKEILPIKGKWYHVHLKRDGNEYRKVDMLRGGETMVTQDLRDVRFSATNHSFRLDEAGNLVSESNELKNTGWRAWSVDWNGKEDLVTCFKACTQTQTGNVYTDRRGIHKLTIEPEKNIIRGKFADEYPSANCGDIFFFRDKATRDKFMADFLLEIQKTDDASA